MIPATQRYAVETGLMLACQVPAESEARVLAAIRNAAPLTWGDYDAVSFASAEGRQDFRSLGSGRNAATQTPVSVPCIELRIFLNVEDAPAVVAAIYAAHPYEEPVITLWPASRTLHRRGQDEDNPNRFWNRGTADWVPPAHRT